MLRNLEKTPWPWFGGKTDAAPAVWQALGDVHHYVEPFAGSLAVLLRRPHECNRTYYSETVNDLDGLLVNAWRAMQMSPDAMADAASWPVSEADLHARHLALVRWRNENELGRLMADPTWHDPVMAGWWAWGQSCWIGSGWCAGTGPWRIGADGRIEKQARAGTREPGVKKPMPHLGNNGQGVNRPQAREPGVAKQLPHLGNDGKGVNRPQSREPGVAVESDDIEFHPMTMPEVKRWFQFLSARLRHVRILNGEWERATTSGAVLSLRVRQGGVAGVFLDPPYADTAQRASSIYAVDSETVSHKVREWCIENGSDERKRIVLAGFTCEHDDLARHGWRQAEWFKQGFLKGGMGQQGKAGTSQARERLWLSPHCLDEKVSE